MFLLRRSEDVVGDFFPLGANSDYFRLTGQYMCLQRRGGSRTASPKINGNLFECANSMPECQVSTDPVQRLPAVSPSL